MPWEVCDPLETEMDVIGDFCDRHSIHYYYNTDSHSWIIEELPNQVKLIMWLKIMYPTLKHLTIVDI